MSTSVSDSLPLSADLVASDQDPNSIRTNSSGHSPKRDRIIKRIVTVVSTLLVVGVLFLVIRLQGYVRGTEFSPEHFQQRRFSFFEIPLIHVQITPIRRTANTTSTAKYLRLNSLISSPPPRANPTWHLVSISRGWSGNDPANAELLATQLGLEHRGDQYWKTWSVDHPKLAKVLWPRIQDLAKRELYVLIPPLFEIAQNDQTPEQLRAAIQTRIVTDLSLLVEDLREAGRLELADQILAEALKDYPNDEKLGLLSSAAD